MTLVVILCSLITESCVTFVTWEQIMNQFCSEGYMSPVWSSMDAGPVISLSMFCPHMVLLANTVVPVRQELTLHVYKQNRG